MLEKKKTHMFRGVSGVTKFLWFWDLAWMLLAFTGAITDHSTLNLVMGLLFAVCWMVADWMRRMDNRKYDEVYELRAATVRVLEDLDRRG